MEDLQVEDFNDPIEHKAEQTADGIKTPEKQESDEEQTSIFKEIMSCRETVLSETVLHMCLESQREGILLYSGIRMTRVRFM